MVLQRPRMSSIGLSTILSERKNDSLYELLSAASVMVRYTFGVLCRMGELISKNYIVRVLKKIENQKSRNAAFLMCPPSA